MALIGTPIRRGLYHYGRFLADHVAICAPIGFVIMVAALTAALLGQKLVKEDYGSMFSSIIPRNSLYILQYVLSFLTSGDVAKSIVFSPSIRTVSFIVDFKEQVPLTVGMLDDMWNFQETIAQVTSTGHCNLRYDHEKIMAKQCEEKFLPPYEQRVRPFPLSLMMVPLETEAPDGSSVTTTWTEAPVTCAFSGSVNYYRSLTDTEKLTRFRNMAIPGHPVLAESYCHDSPRVPWSMTDSLLEPQFDVNGHIKSFRGYKVKVQVNNAMYCTCGYRYLTEGAIPEYHGNVYKQFATVAWIKGIYDRMRQGTWITDSTALPPYYRAVEFAMDGHYMFSSFLTSFNVKEIAWGIVPVVVFLFVFMHRDIWFNRLWLVRSRIMLFLWSLILAVTACLFGRAFMGFAGINGTVINSAAVLLGIGLAVDDILVILSQLDPRGALRVPGRLISGRLPKELRKPRKQRKSKKRQSLRSPRRSLDGLPALGAPTMDAAFEVHPNTDSVGQAVELVLGPDAHDADESLSSTIDNTTMIPGVSEFNDQTTALAPEPTVLPTPTALQDLSRTPREQLGKALERTGVTIFCTSVTTVVSAYLTSFSRLPALGSFGVQAAASVTAVYVLFMLSWLPMCALHLTRVADSRMDIIYLRLRAPREKKPKTPQIVIEQEDVDISSDGPANRRSSIDDVNATVDLVDDGSPALAAYRARLLAEARPISAVERTLSLKYILSRFIVLVTYRPLAIVLSIGVIVMAILGLMMLPYVKFRTNPSSLGPAGGYFNRAAMLEQEISARSGIDGYAVNVGAMPTLAAPFWEQLVNMLNALRVNSALKLVITKPIELSSTPRAVAEEQLLLTQQRNAIESSLVPKNSHPYIPPSSRVSSLWDGYALFNGSQYWPSAASNFSDYVASPQFKPYAPDPRQGWRSYTSLETETNMCVEVAKLCDITIQIGPLPIRICNTTQKAKFIEECAVVAPDLADFLKSEPIASTVFFRMGTEKSDYIENATKVVGVRVPDPSLVKVTAELLKSLETTIAENADAIAQQLNDIMHAQGMFNADSVKNLVSQVMSGRTEELLSFAMASFEYGFLSVIDANMRRELLSAVVGVLLTLVVVILLFFDLGLAFITIVVVVFEYGFLFFCLWAFSINFDLVWLLFTIISSGILVDHALHVIGEFANVPAGFSRRVRCCAAFNELSPALLGGWLTSVFSLIGALGTQMTLIYRGFFAMLAVQGVSLFFSFVLLPSLLSLIGPKNVRFVQIAHSIRDWYHAIGHKVLVGTFEVNQDDVNTAHSLVEGHSTLESQHEREELEQE